MAQSRQPSIKEIVAELERFFGQDVEKISAPGGKGRASYRVFFEDRTIIVTYRDDKKHALIEADVLMNLSPHCSDMPQFLGFENNFLYQSDVGDIRLSQEVNEAGNARRLDLAAEAVASIFRIQDAARKINYRKGLRHSGATEKYVTGMVNAIDQVAASLDQEAPKVDRDRLCDQVFQPPNQFLRWDCRSGNAALDPSGKLRWFDFEYAGLRHGAEDFAWLIADEIWPVDPDAMFAIVGDAFDPATGHTRDAYLEFLSIFTTFQAIQRILLVLSNVVRRGWSPQAKVMRYDKVGTHPLLGVRVADTAAYCADRHVLTRPLRPMLEAMSRKFAAAIQGGPSKLAS